MRYVKGVIYGIRTYIRENPRQAVISSFGWMYLINRIMIAFFITMTLRLFITENIILVKYSWVNGLGLILTSSIMVYFFIHVRLIRFLEQHLKIILYLGELLFWVIPAIYFTTIAFVVWNTADWIYFSALVLFTPVYVLCVYIRLNYVYV